MRSITGRGGAARYSRSVVAAGVLALMVSVCVPALAQQADEPTGPTPLLTADHWAVRAAWRAEALGLVDDFLPAQRSVARHEIARVLWEAAGAADSRTDGLAELTAGWVARFVEEFPASASTADGGAMASWEAGVTAGLEYREGAAAPGMWIREAEQTGAIPLEDRTTAIGGMRFAVPLGDQVVLSAAPMADRDNFRQSRYDARVRIGPVELAAGRHPFGYGRARGGTVSLSGFAPLNRVEFQTFAPVELPWVLRFLGPTSVHFSIASLDEPRHADRDPWFWGGALAFQPHPRLSFSINRTAMFGGHGEYGDGDLENFLWMLIGNVKGRGFENQQVSVEGRWRLPTESVLPLVAYLEWGSEDAAGAWFDVPGRVGGLYVPAVPNLPQLAIGAEMAEFRERCCGNPPWYRHSAFRGAWASGDVVLGHPLGGEGREFRGFADLDLLDSRLRLEAEAFHRDRGSENLFSPERLGTSVGGSVEVGWRVMPRSDLTLRADFEGADEWTSERIFVGTQIYF